MIQPKVKTNKKKKEANRDKIIMSFIYIVLVFAIVVLFFTAKSIILPKKTITEKVTVNQMSRLSTMSLTGYDRQLAIKFMDKNGDSRCDVCGMDVELCMDSGQIECNMDSKSKIGVLGSQHIHADWKIYINGKPFDWSPYGDLHERQMIGDNSVSGTSAFMHVHPAQLPEKTGDVLHMHATDVSLWIFFDSIELKLPNKMKAYINGKEIPDYENYVFNDLDKILITDGIGDLQQQLNSITNFSKNH